MVCDRISLDAKSVTNILTRKNPIGPPNSNENIFFFKKSRRKKKKFSSTVAGNPRETKRPSFGKYSLLTASAHKDIDRCSKIVRIFWFIPLRAFFFLHRERDESNWVFYWPRLGPEGKKKKCQLMRAVGAVNSVNSINWIFFPPGTRWKWENCFFN